MGTSVDSSNNIIRSGTALASDYNDIANHFRQWFPVSFTGPSAGTVETAALLNSLRQAIINGAGNGWGLDNFPGSFYVGQKNPITTWGKAHALFQTTTINYTAGTYSYTIPAGCNSIIIKQAIAGGGGGGAGCQAGGGYSGGGGGSGGCITSAQTFSVAAGDVVSIVVGDKGLGPVVYDDHATPWGYTNPGTVGNQNYRTPSAGGNTTIAINGNNILTLTGGGAAGDGVLWGNGHKGGTGGSPNGVTADDGDDGGSHHTGHAKSAGATGASSPLGTGGVGGDPRGTWGTVGASSWGQCATGYGAGGGGGSNYDGSRDTDYTPGGDGSPGYVTITYHAAADG